MDNRIFANGNAITISDGTNNNTSKITYGNNIIFVDNFDLSIFSVFGGSKNASVNSTSITMTGGTVKSIFAGGSGADASNVAGVGGNTLSYDAVSKPDANEAYNANVIISGGKVTTKVAGGGVDYAYVGSVNIEISGNAKVGNVTGGGNNLNTGVTENTNIVGYANIMIKDGAEIKYMDGEIDYGSVYGGGFSYAYVGEAEITVGGNASAAYVTGGGMNGVTNKSTINVLASAKIGLLSGVNRGIVNEMEFNILDSFQGTIDQIALGGCSSYEDSNTQFHANTSDGAIIGSVTLNVPNSALKSSDENEPTKFFLGRGLYSNYGKGGFTCNGVQYYQHYTYSSTAIGGAEALTSVISVDVTVNGNALVIADVGETHKSYDPTTFIIGNDKTWTFENGAIISFTASEITTELQNGGKLIFDGANVGEDGLVLTCGGDIEIKNTDFTKKGLYIKGANNVTIQNCEFTGIIEDLQLANNSPHMHHPSAIHVDSAKGIVTIKGNILDNIHSESLLDSISGENKNKFMGISVTSNDDSPGSITISDNKITDVLHNAIYTIGKFSSISITNNVIENWASQSTEDKGRAIRIDMKLASNNIEVSGNTFVKSYTDIVGFGNSGKYDDGNILKIDVDAAFKDNVLVLSGIDSYSYADLFIIGSDENKKMVTFDPNGGYYYTSSEPGVLCSIITADSTVSEPADPLRSGSYSFDGWYDAATGGNKLTFPLNITENTTLYAKWTYTGGSGIPVTPPTDDPEPEPIVPDENNNVTVPSIDDKKADELVHKAVSSGSDSISIIDTSDVKGEYTEVTVSKSDLETISKKIENNNNINSVSIETSEGDIIIEKEVLNSILKNTDADSVSFEIEDAKDKLTEEQKKAVGDRPVYDINIKAGNENITSFDGKTITISLPYTLKPGEDPENIVVYYVKEDGSLEKMNCTYKDGKVIFETDHLSKYVIGYEESDKPVTPDTPDNKKDDNNTIYYAVAAIVVILIIIALAYYFMKKKQ